MKITGFEVFPVVCPPPFRGGRSWLFVRLDTDEGSPNFLIMEAVERFDGVHARFTEERFDWQDGYLLPPRGPGLGFTLREDVARRHAPQGPQPGTIRSY